MPDELKGKKIAFLATDMFEEVELTKPWEALKEAGAELELVSLKDGEIQGFNHYDKAGTTKIGDVDFSVPAAARRATLLVGDDPSKAIALPVRLAPRH